jgi:hypothetical protein
MIRLLGETLFWMLMISPLRNETIEILTEPTTEEALLMLLSSYKTTQRVLHKKSGATHTKPYKYLS